MNVASLLQDSPSEDRRHSVSSPGSSHITPSTSTSTPKDKPWPAPPVGSQTIYGRASGPPFQSSVQAPWPRPQPSNPNSPPGDRDREPPRERERERIYEPSSMYTGTLAGKDRERDRKRDRDREIAERERKDREWVLHGRLASPRQNPLLLRGSQLHVHTPLSSEDLQHPQGLRERRTSWFCAVKRATLLQIAKAATTTTMFIMHTLIQVDQAPRACPQLFQPLQLKHPHHHLLLKAPDQRQGPQNYLPINDMHR